jgi:hypothetical protein
MKKGVEGQKGSIVLFVELSPAERGAAWCKEGFGGDRAGCRPTLRPISDDSISEDSISEDSIRDEDWTRDDPIRPSLACSGPTRLLGMTEVCADVCSGFPRRQSSALNNIDTETTSMIATSSATLNPFSL